MIEILIRWVIGGLIIAAIPEVAKYFGPRVAGMMLLAPIITIIGIILVNQQSGKTSLFPMLETTTISILPLLLFLIVLYAGLNKLALPLALTSATIVWAVSAGLLLSKLGS
jgi:membrane protein GlpM